jgi:hypothetical protein
VPGTVRPGRWVAVGAQPGESQHRDHRGHRGHGCIDPAAGQPRRRQEKGQEQQPGHRHRNPAGAHPGQDQHHGHAGHGQSGPPVHPGEEAKRGQEQQPGDRHGDLAGPVPGPCRVDGQDERAGGSGGEQGDPAEHHACVCHVAQVAVRDGEETPEPPGWCQSHSDPGPGGQRLGRLRLDGDHADLRSYAPRIRVARSCGARPRGEGHQSASWRYPPARRSSPARRGPTRAPIGARRPAAATARRRGYARPATHRATRAPCGPHRRAGSGPAR